MLELKTNFEEMIQSLQLRLQEAENQETDQLARLETCIRICKESLIQLREWILANSFPDKENEIYFFKQVKPVILARYIYYQKIYRLHIGYFNGSTLLKKEWLERELQHIKRYFESNQNFYTYYRTGATHFDEGYFTRRQCDCEIKVNPFDLFFSTRMDRKLAGLMAQELLLKYIDELLRLACMLADPTPGQMPTLRSNHASLSCTANITDAVELGYALYAVGFFNNGKASLKNIMNRLSDEFHINLQNYSHTFGQIRERKTNQTKYLDELKAGLIRYIDQFDSKK